MFASKFIRMASLALFALAPAVVAVPRSVRALEQGIGRGTVSLPNFESEGMLTAALSSDDGARYCLDAALTQWIPSLPIPGLAFGGVYGELYEALPAGQGYKGLVEGSWLLLSEDTGHIEARVLRADDSGALRVVGAISGKFRLFSQPNDGVGDMEAARSQSFVLAGDLSLEYVLAHGHR